MPSFKFSPTIEWLQKTYITPSSGWKGFAILDCENVLVKHSKELIIEFFKEFFNKCMIDKMMPILISKTSHLPRFRQRVEGVDIPDFIPYFFLHGVNHSSTDDAFILELCYTLLNNKIHAKIVTDDKFMGLTPEKCPSAKITWNQNPIRPPTKSKPGYVSKAKLEEAPMSISAMAIGSSAMAVSSEEDDDGIVMGGASAIPSLAMGGAGAMSSSAIKISPKVMAVDAKPAIPLFYYNPNWAAIREMLKLLLESK